MTEICITISHEVEDRIIAALRDAGVPMPAEEVGKPDLVKQMLLEHIKRVVANYETILAAQAAREAAQQAADEEIVIS